MEILKLEQRHQGAIGESGRFTGYTKDKEGNEKKDATYDYQHIDWEKHFKGEKYLGLSPVEIIQNGIERKGYCRWVAWDLDFEQEPEISLEYPTIYSVTELLVITGTFISTMTT